MIGRRAHDSGAAPSPGAEARRLQHERNPHMRYPISAWTMVATACALLCSSAPQSARAATPGTTAHFFSSHPMISGHIVSVNDHQLIVNTDQGEQVTLDIDSRTLAPRDVQPGMVVRTEFVAMPDCHFYAERIMPLRTGTSGVREQVYANTQDSPSVIMRNATATGGPMMDKEHTMSMDQHMALMAKDRRETSNQTIGPHSPGTVMTATRATADHGYSSSPMMSGRVLSANDHRVMVATEQGQLVGLVMDSRTLLPAEVGPGVSIRAEFTPMQDGRFYANRVHVVRETTVEREQAYAHTLDGVNALAQNTTDCNTVHAMVEGPVRTVYVEHRDTVQVFVAQAAPRSAGDPAPVLPQTASTQPWLLLASFLALGGGGGAMLLRASRTL